MILRAPIYNPPVPKKSDRRAITLSISLTPELSELVSERVQGGLYTSASELVREALRLLFRTERDAEELRPLSAARLEIAAELMETGLAIREQKVRSAEPGLSDEEVRDRIRALDAEAEAGPGLRISPERLQKLKLREPD